MGASTASSAPSALESSLDSLALLEATTDHAEILGSSLNQDVDGAGALFDTVEVYWRLYGRPGTFTSRVPSVVNWLALVFVDVGEKVNIVQGIYDGLDSMADLPKIPPDYVSPAFGPKVPL